MPPNTPPPSQASASTDWARFAFPERLRLLESVAVYANDAVIITEASPVNVPGPRIVYVNAAFERMTGYAANEVIGLTPRVLQGPLTAATARREIRESLAEWRSIQIELLNYRKDGTPFWVELSISPVADDIGWYTHWVSVQREVTARHDAAALADHAEYVEAQNVRLSKEIAERQLAESRLAKAANRDDLTGLRNRAFFIRSLGATLERVEAVPFVFAVIFFDLDRFKVINDNLGHGAGDRLLALVAKRVGDLLEASSVFARMGGDEFAILAEVAGPGGAAALAERILESLRRPVALGDVALSANASIGIAVRSTDSVTPEDVLRDADIAMYRAKRAGGDRFAIFEESMKSEAFQTYQMHGELRHALETNAFEVYYQPIVRLETAETIGFEALVRWNHPERGIIAPQEFITIAEESGLIVPLGAYVLRVACETMEAWRRRFASARGMKMSVNVSAVQLRDASFRDRLCAILSSSGLPPTSLQLEITESVFLEDADRSGVCLQSLRELGVSIAFDDFGTGYSSLSYLERFAVDVLKIDRSFVVRLTDDVRNVEIMRAIAALGAVLELEVLAEGIETDEQRRLALSIGCTSAQGYLFSRPVPGADIERRFGLA